MRTTQTAVLATAAAVFLSMTAMAEGATMKQSFGKTKDGAAIDIYTLKNSKGMEARIMTYGGIVVSLKVPDKSGKTGDVVLGFDNGDAYVGGNNAYFGALIGRYGNRIGGAKFTLNGKEYHVPANDGKNSLHGGLHGFDKHFWKAVNADDHSLELNYVSKDGEEGYPGTLNATVKYTVTDNNELKIEYSATTDKDTVLNLTNHSYFNLSGPGSGDILSHEISINADRFTPVDSGLIPTGELKKVEGTPFDFRKSHTIGERINAKDEQIKLGKGYDHNFVLNSSTGMNVAAVVFDPKSGRKMEVVTDQPGVQFYTGNFLDGTLSGKGVKYAHRGGLCLETQHFPDSPNRASFPSTTLKAGSKYSTTTMYRFSTAK